MVFVYFYFVSLCCVFCVMCFCLFCFFFFKQKTAYEMRISDWSSDVCSSDLDHFPDILLGREMVAPVAEQGDALDQPPADEFLDRIGNVGAREPEHLGNLLGMERTVGNEEQRMNLRHRDRKSTRLNSSH